MSYLKSHLPIFAGGAADETATKQNIKGSRPQGPCNKVQHLIAVQVPCFTKLFTVVIHFYRGKIECVCDRQRVHLSLICAEKDGLTEWSTLPDSTHPALPANIRFGLKWQTVTNTLAYCVTTLITAVKSFMIQRPMLLNFLRS